jgi:hypothetical protein
MTISERAQVLADAYECPWFVVTDRTGCRNLVRDLAEAYCCTGMQVFHPRQNWPFDLRWS